MGEESSSQKGWAALADGLRAIGRWWPGAGASSPTSACSRPRTRAERIDVLTGLPTRLGLMRELERLFGEAERRGRELTLLYIGIDDLHAVIELQGHDAGDRLVCALAERLKAEPPRHTLLARIQSAEFAVVLPEDEAGARALSTRLIDSLAAPGLVDGLEGGAACSIGLATYPKAGARHQMLGFALTAMLAARRLGGSAYAEYDPRMGVDRRETGELARDLQHAVERGEFELMYQPKIDARSLQVTAAEALLRWHHPSRGVVSPAQFIPLAERCRLIGDIGNWVVDEAVRQGGLWRDLGFRMRVAMNVSAYQMRQDDFVDRLARALKKSSLNPARFTCEVTETMAMEDTAATRRAFERLRALGVHVSIDDFGTGHSSLAVLRRLPARELKIDRAFVADLDSGPDACTIVQTIVRMAHTLELRVVAEGVETEAQRDALVGMGCDELQGFLFARPMSARALGLWALDEKSTHGAAFRPSIFRETGNTNWATTQEAQAAGTARGHKLRPR